MNNEKRTEEKKMSDVREQALNNSRSEEFLLLCWVLGQIEFLLGVEAEIS